MKNMIYQMAAITKTHRDYFRKLAEGNLTLEKWKVVRNKCYPDMTLHPGSSDEWKKQRPVLELIKELYAGTRTLAEVSEENRALLAEYSTNLELLFMSDPSDFDLRDLPDIECVWALGNYAQALELPDPPALFVDLKESIRAFGEAMCELTLDNVGEMETPQREALFAQLSDADLASVTRSGILDELVGKSVSNAGILLAKKRKIHEMTVDVAPEAADSVTLVRENLLLMPTGVLKFLSSLHGDDMDSSRKKMLTSLEGVAHDQLAFAANKGIAFSNTFLENDKLSVKIPAKEMTVGQVILICCGSRSGDNSVRLFQVQTTDNERVVLSAVSWSADNELPPTMFVDLTSHPHLWVRALHDTEGPLKTMAESAELKAPLVFASRLIARRSVVAETAPVASATSSAPPAPSLGFRTVNAGPSQGSHNCVDMTIPQDNRLTTMRTSAETDRETVLAPFKLLVNDEARVKTLLPVSKVTDTLCINNILHELPEHLQQYAFADAKYIPALLQLMVAPINAAKDSKCISVRLFTPLGKEFQTVNQLRVAIEILAFSFDVIISKAKEHFMRDLWQPWLTKLSRMFEGHFCEFNVLFLEKEVTATLAKMATALRRPGLDDKERDVVKAILAEAMMLDEAALMQRGMFDTVLKAKSNASTQKQPPLPPAKPWTSGQQGNRSGSGQSGGYGNNINSQAGNASSSSSSSIPSNSQNQQQRPANTAPCISQMMHLFLKQPVCNRSNCNFDHNIKSFPKEKLVQSATQAKGHWAGKLIEYCKNLQG